MGAELIVGSALGGLGLIGSAISTSEANSTARSENAQNRAYSAYEAEKQRQWSTNERLAAQAYNTSEREAAQRYQTASVGQNVMNSIAAMRAAGVNANVLGSSAINSGATGSPAGSSSPASGAAASYGTGINPQIMQIPQLMQGSAGFINALSKNTETRANLPLIDANVKLALEKMYGQQKANELQELYVKFEKANLPTKIKKSMEEYVALTLQNGNAVRQGRVFEKQEELTAAQKRVQDMIAKLKGAEAIQAQFYADRVADIYDADMKLKGAQANAANASANASNASARDLNATAEGKELLNNISRATNLLDIDNALFNADTLVLLQQSDNKEALWQQLQRDIKKSSAYKNSENQKRIDASLEKLRQILGINVSVGASASN